MAIEKEKFFEIINKVSKSEGLNKDNLLERIGSELKGINPGAYSTYNNSKIDKLFMIQDSNKTVNCILLHLAVECNSVPIVKLLLEKKVKVDEQMSGDVNSKFTALHIAASHGHHEDDTLEGELALRERNAIAKQLQEAEQRFANNQKRIEQDYLHNQHPEQYTIHNGEQTFLNKSSSNDSGICFDADESEALGQSILENGEDIDAQDENGLTFLHRAAANNNEESVKRLVKCGAKIDVQDKDGLTPLHYAAAYGCVEIGEYLVVNAVNVNAQDKVEHTPLYYALANDNKN